MSSMGSQMMRMDSAAQLSLASSSQSNLHDSSTGKIKQAIGSTTQFTTVAEKDREDSDDESMLQRMDDDDDDDSMMERVADDTTSMSGSVMQRVGADDATSQSASILERVEDGESSQMSIGKVVGKSQSNAAVPKELRALGRAQESYTNLGKRGLGSQDLQN